MVGDVTNSSLTDIYHKVKEGALLSKEELYYLWNNARLDEISQLATIVRNRFNPPNRVTYLIDRNINYTNVCNTSCSFCGFYRPTSSHPESYVLSFEEISRKIEEALELGATRILLQGGHNDELDYDFYVNLIRKIKSKYNIHINAFSPSEIHQISLVSGKGYEEVLMDLKTAGMDGLPGGGAEILDDSVRKRVSPKKIKSDTWLEIMGIAGRLGLVITATMVFGFGEGFEERFNHLKRIRDLQYELLCEGHAGFNAFIAWPLQVNENTSLGRSKSRDMYKKGESEYLRLIGISRIYLDNIPHFQASWPTMGLEKGKMALEFGCDDFGSTMMEENVVSQAGALTHQKWSMSPDELRSAIRSAGYIPAERNCFYEIVQ